MILRKERVKEIRERLASGGASVGSWMQIPSASVAEIMGDSGYDWVAVDLEHGSISIEQLPDLFRALELGGTLPLARIAEGAVKDCKQALDAGAGGIIVPMIESAEQLTRVVEACCWPPAGKRGVGFSRANLFGKYFDRYRDEAQAPLIAAQVETAAAIENLEGILRVKGLDAVIVGPYDLSASMGLTAQFDHPRFLEALVRINQACKAAGVAFGEHVVEPDPEILKARLQAGSRFIAYSIDAVFLHRAGKSPKGTK